MAKDTPIKLLSLAGIRIDGGTQPRAEINTAVVQEYAEALRAGVEFPPLVVFHDGKNYWLADGFHRYHGARGAAFEKLECEIRKGSQREAILFSCGANATHGLRRSNEDKQHAVNTLLQDSEWSKNSDRWIAEACGVHHDMVGRLRSQLAESANSHMGGTRTGRDGKQYQASKKKSESSPREPVSTSSDDLCDAPETDAAPAPAVDERGTPLAGKAIEAFAQRQRFRDLENRIHAIRREIEALGEGPGGEYVSTTIVVGELRNASGQLRAAEPYALCPKCGGNGCRDCKGSGFMPKRVFEHLPKEEATA